MNLKHPTPNPLIVRSASRMRRGKQLNEVAFPSNLNSRPSRRIAAPTPRTWNLSFLSVQVGIHSYRVPAVRGNRRRTPWTFSQSTRQSHATIEHLLPWPRFYTPHWHNHKRAPRKVDLSQVGGSLIGWNSIDAASFRGVRGFVLDQFHRGIALGLDPVNDLSRENRQLLQVRMHAEQ